MKSFKQFMSEAVPTNSTGSGIANYIPYLFKNEDDDDLTQDYQTKTWRGPQTFISFKNYQTVKVIFIKLMKDPVDGTIERIRS